MILTINYSIETRAPMQRKHLCIVMRVGSIKLIVSFAKLIHILTNKFWETVLATPWSCYSYFCQKIILMEITYKKVFPPQTLAKQTCPNKRFQNCSQRPHKNSVVFVCLFLIRFKFLRFGLRSLSQNLVRSKRSSERVHVCF
jgi:hypothetical protein